jgi:hypothetical protein
MMKITGLLLFLFIFAGCARHSPDPFSAIRDSLKKNYNSIRAEYQKNKAQELNGDAEFLAEEGIWVRRKLTSISESYLLDVQKTNKADVPYIAFIEFIYYYNYGEWKDEAEAARGRPHEERRESERCYFTYQDNNWEISESKILSTKRKNEKGEWEDIRPVATGTETIPEEAAPPTAVPGKKPGGRPGDASPENGKF